MSRIDDTVIKEKMSQSRSFFQANQYVLFKNKFNNFFMEKITIIIYNRVKQT